MRVLVVDDDASIAELLRLSLTEAGYDVTVASAGDSAYSLIAAGSFETIVCDVDLPGMDGITLYRRVAAEAKARGGEPPSFVLISGQARIIDSLNTMELGVSDFLPKPFNIDRLLAVMRQIGERRRAYSSPENRDLAKRLAAQPRMAIADLPEPRPLVPADGDPFIGIYGKATASVCERLSRMGEYPEIPILIEGETGTGKEIAARYVHLMDKVNTGAFVALNCSLFNSDLFAAEFFGYEKGAFTGADVAGKPGKIEVARGGTLFLDEITEITPELQARLLRVIQEREYYKVGGSAVKKVESRIVCASNRDIPRLVREGAFREDLFFRLSACTIRIPPLRERQEEIVPLALRFLRSLVDTRLSARFVETGALLELEQYPWPGNVRELQNLIISWVVLGKGDTLTREHLRERLDVMRRRTAGSASADVGDAAGLDLERIVIPDTPFQLEELNRSIVSKVLSRFGGNKTKTAAFLGISRSQLYDRFKVPRDG
jgi:two-component system response regulator AtoC